MIHLLNNNSEVGCQF